MIDGRFIVGIEGLKETGFIRFQVFTEDQGVDPKVEQDIYDHFAHHLIIKDNGNPVGTGRLILKDKQCLIGRIAVLPNERGKQYGDLIVRMLIDRVFSMGCHEVHVHSQIHAIGFYEKIGFVKKGESYMESGIEHISMVLTPESLNQGCQGCQH